MTDNDGVTVFILENSDCHTVTYIKTLKEQNTLITVLASNVFWGQNTNLGFP